MSKPVLTLSGVPETELRILCNAIVDYSESLDESGYNAIWYCNHCTTAVTYSWSKDADNTLDHDEDCPVKLAKRWLFMLDNQE